ncbi:MAG TPA: rhamnulokinase family protein [Methylococcales bacterium]
MSTEKMYIAVDLGAESGRVMLGSVSGEKITLEEIYRFSNGPIEHDGSLRWDFAKLFSEVKTGIGKAVKASGGKVCGIGVDTWGVDYGLLDEKGKLVENPYHYRDGRTGGMIEKSFEFMTKREIYENTGLQFMLFNTLYQLLSVRLANGLVCLHAHKLLFMADLISFHLCGKEYAEYTLASTSQLMDMHTGKWSKAIFDKLSLPMHIMPEVVQAGTVVGKLTDAVAKEIGADGIPVIAVGSHDTADAVAAVPASGGKWAYLSSGTWSLMGVETPKAVINDKSFGYEFTNEGGVCGTIRLLKNIIGLWLLQECRRQWQREGAELSYDQIADAAVKAKPFAAFIDVDHTEFYSPGDMPAKINGYLKSTGQNVISDKGQMARVILESLAIKYRRVMEMLEDTIGYKIETLHIVGGGIKNELLCQFTADAINKKVIAGPAEATALGNIMMQAVATGQIKTVEQGRTLVAGSVELKTYMPQDVNAWEEHYKKVTSNI